MGQSSNNGGRNASLDDKKQRAAGRGTRGSARDFEESQPGQGQAMGAFGSGKTSKRARSASSKHGNAGSAGKPKR